MLRRAARTRRRGGLGVPASEHNRGRAAASQYDLDHAWPFFSYVIISVREGEPQDLQSWRLRDDRSAFDEEAIGAQSAPQEK
jgi:hypothetical protein